MTRLLKDLLLVEMSVSGTDPEKDCIADFAALLLDKDNLLEKDMFQTAVKNSILETILTAHALASHTPIALLKTGLKPIDFLKTITARFAQPAPMLAVSNFSALIFLRSAFKKQAINFPFPPPFLDIWTMHYLFAVKNGLSKLPSTRSLCEYFSLPLPEPYDTLSRVKTLAQIFRAVQNAS